MPRKAKNDVLFLLEHGKWRPAGELITRVESMLEGNEEFTLIDEQDEAFRIIRHQVLSDEDRSRRHVFVVEGGPGTGTLRHRGALAGRDSRSRTESTF